MPAFELCYATPKGAGVVKYLHDAASTEEALKRLAKRHIEADLYVAGERDAKGNRTPRVGGVDHLEGDHGGRVIRWQWWFDPAAFAAAPSAI